MKTFIGSIVAVVVLLVYVIGGMTHVSVGSIGLVKHMNGDISEVPQGFHWKGWGVTVQDYPTYRQALGGKDGVTLNVGTSDQQELPVTTNLNWNIDVTKLKTLYQSVGGNDIDYVANTIVLPTMKNDINKVTHTYSWNAIKGNEQASVTKEIEKLLKSDLAKSGIELVNFGFSNVGSPAGMAQSQQSLASAELATKQAQQAQEKAKIENETKIMNAEADAKANQITQQSITPQLLQKWTIEKWNGQLPQVEGGANPLINLNLK
jgi:regulator of protease activity HflC (stomatin/prohibitin superfamily)